MKLEPFDAFCLFMALRNHFTQESYDFFRYHGKTKHLSKEKFEVRKDRAQYQKLARKVEAEELKGYIIANLILGKEWIGDFLTEEAEQAFHAYKERNGHIHDMVQDELEAALRNLKDSKALFKAEEESMYPPLLLKAMDGTLSYETLIVLERFCDYFPTFDRMYGEDDIVWGKIRFICQKLSGFVEFDKEELKTGLSRILLS